MPQDWSGWDLECKVYAGNLPLEVDKYLLEKEFAHYGPLRNLWVARNPPGFAFVEYDDKRDAEDAVRGLDNVIFQGRRLRVQMSTGRTKQENGGLSQWSYSSRSRSSSRSSSYRYRSWSRSRSRSTTRSRSRRRRSDSESSRSRSRSYKRDKERRYYSDESSVWSRSRSRTRSPRRRREPTPRSVSSNYSSRSRSPASYRSEKTKSVERLSRRDHRHVQEPKLPPDFKLESHNSIENHSDSSSIGLVPDLSKQARPRSRSSSRSSIGSAVKDTGQTTGAAAVAKDSCAIQTGPTQSVSVQTDPYLLLHFVQKMPQVLEETFLRLDRDHILNNCNYPEIVPSVYQRKTCVATQRNQQLLMTGGASSASESAKCELNLNCAAKEEKNAVAIKSPKVHKRRSKTRENLSSKTHDVSSSESIKRENDDSMDTSATIGNKNKTKSKKKSKRRKHRSKRGEELLVTAGEMSEANDKKSTTHRLLLTVSDGDEAGNHKDGGGEKVNVVDNGTESKNKSPPSRVTENEPAELVSDSLVPCGQTARRKVTMELTSRQNKVTMELTSRQNKLNVPLKTSTPDSLRPNPRPSKHYLGASSRTKRKQQRLDKSTDDNKAGDSAQTQAATIDLNFSTPAKRSRLFDDDIDEKSGKDQAHTDGVTAARTEVVCREDPRDIHELTDRQDLKDNNNVMTDPENKTVSDSENSPQRSNLKSDDMQAKQTARQSAKTSASDSTNLKKCMNDPESIFQEYEKFVEGIE